LKFAPYSFSKINTFLSCPKKYEFSYIEKIKTFEKNLATERGSYIHSLFENKTKGKDTVFNFDAMSEDDVHACDDIFRNYISSPKGAEYFSGTCETKAEVGFGVKLVGKQLAPCSYYNKGAIFRGKIDHQIIHGDLIELLDFKTGKISAFPAPLQLVMYSAWAFMKYPDINTVRTAFLYVEHLEEKEYIFHRKHFSTLVKKVVEKISQIEKATNFPKNESKLCEYCDYRKTDLCEPETNEEFGERISKMVKVYTPKTKRV